jgi:hypothetical protein
VNVIPSYYVSETRNVNVFHLHLPSGHSLLYGRPILMHAARNSGDTKLAFMILVTERTILHDLENSSNIHDFVIGMFTEEIVTWN